MAILRPPANDGTGPSLGCSKSPTSARPTKLQSVAIHMFRDTFAVELLNKGVPIDRVSLLLGH